jgi:diadenosine tetraphosphate (Ap4A) HIT family hydrolase
VVVDCPFCHPEPGRAWVEHPYAIVIRDAFPVSEGHMLVVPRQHVASLFELPQEVQQAIWGLVAEVREQLTAEYSPDGFNVGVNDGQAAGQTVDHAHVHVIPRYAGDVPDPRGGIRWIIPAKAAYWK